MIGQMVKIGKPGLLQDKTGIVLKSVYTNPLTRTNTYRINIQGYGAWRLHESWLRPVHRPCLMEMNND